MADYTYQAQPGYQPPAQQQAPVNSSWVAGLFGCFGDIEGCLFSWCLPCVLHAENKQALYKTDSFASDAAIFCCVQFCTGLGCLLNMSVRRDIREMSGIQGGSMGDCCTHCCCGCCAMVQEKQQLKYLKDAGRL